jgi:hypothetical protein
VLCSHPCLRPAFDDVSDQAARAFDERKFVRKAALKQYADAIVTGRVGSGDERDVLPDAEVNQMIGLGQDEEVPRYRRFDLLQFSAEVLDENFLKATAQLHRLLGDELKALIEHLVNPLRHEHPRLKSLLYVGVLCDLAELLENFCRVLVALPYIAQQGHEQFFWVFYRHNYISAVIFVRNYLRHLKPMTQVSL